MRLNLPLPLSQPPEMQRPQPLFVCKYAHAMYMKHDGSVESKKHFLVFDPGRGI